MHHLTIAPPEPKTPTASRKGRSFGAEKVCHITANAMWEGGRADTQTIRPVLLRLLGTESGLRAFTANVRMGRPMEVPSGKSYGHDAPTRYECLRSAKYTYTTQRTPDGAICTIYQSALLALDPGLMDPELISFVCLTPDWWTVAQFATIRQDAALCQALVRAGQLIDPDTKADTLLGLAPHAMRVAAYLEKRTRRPMPAGIPFALALLLAAHQAGLLEHAVAQSYSRYAVKNSKRRTGLQEDGCAAAGIGQLCACRVSHQELDAFLAQLVHRYLTTIGDA